MERWETAGTPRQAQIHHQEVDKVNLVRPFDIVHIRCMRCGGDVWETHASTIECPSCGMKYEVLRDEESPSKWYIKPCLAENQALVECRCGQKLVAEERQLVKCFKCGRKYYYSNGKLKAIRR